HQLSKVEMYDMTGALINVWDTDQVQSTRLHLEKTLPTGNYLFRLTRISGESDDHQVMILNNR
ncbi:MAG: T9SS type A sorting domain-containing protein, partial [Saprospiraceae bacterium]|nr:T9SS type A sorting domain-containing protein [Saprospiraceae bacterium]